MMGSYASVGRTAYVLCWLLVVLHATGRWGEVGKSEEVVNL